MSIPPPRGAGACDFFTRSERTIEHDAARNRRKLSADDRAMRSRRDFRGLAGRVDAHRPYQGRMKTNNRATVCLWFDGDAEEAAKFYASTFPNSSVGAVMRAPSDFPSGHEGDPLLVEFTVLGIPCVGLNGGPEFKHSEAFSFQVITADQAETDRYWNAIVGNGGMESECSWCKDKWGISWQITPRVLMEAMAKGGDVAKRAFTEMMTMKKIDVARIERAVRG